MFQVYENVEHFVCYFSRKLDKYQISYSTVEKEASALISAVRLFAVYFGSILLLYFPIIHLCSF